MLEIFSSICFIHAAYELDETVKSMQDLVEFLKHIPAMELMKHTSNTKIVSSEGDPKQMFVEWNPTIERAHTLQNAKRDREYKNRNDLIFLGYRPFRTPPIFKC